MIFTLLFVYIDYNYLCCLFIAYFGVCLIVDVDWCLLGYCCLCLLLFWFGLLVDLLVGLVFLLLLTLILLLSGVCF